MLHVEQALKRSRVDVAGTSGHMNDNVVLIVTGMLHERGVHELSSGRVPLTPLVRQVFVSGVRFLVCIVDSCVSVQVVIRDVGVGIQSSWQFMKEEFK